MHSINEVWVQNWGKS